LIGLGVRGSFVCNIFFKIIFSFLPHSFSSIKFSLKSLPRFYHRFLRQIQKAEQDLQHVESELKQLKSIVKSGKSGTVKVITRKREKDGELKDENAEEEDKMDKKKAKEKLKEKKNVKAKDDDDSDSDEEIEPKKRQKEKVEKQELEQEKVEKEKELGKEVLVEEVQKNVTPEQAEKRLDQVEKKIERLLGRVTTLKSQRTTKVRYIVYVLCCVTFILFNFLMQ
jgi:tetrahydromethanopterin S-methyltransferase subunit G